MGGNLSDTEESHKSRCDLIHELLRVTLFRVHSCHSSLQKVFMFSGSTVLTNAIECELGVCSGLQRTAVRCAGASAEVIVRLAQRGRWLRGVGGTLRQLLGPGLLGIVRLPEGMGP